MSVFTRGLLSAAIVLVLAGCSKTLSVDGQLQGKAETFQGTATGYMDGSGHLKIVTSEGAVCKGDFVYTSFRRGEGVFNCDDGRSGPFQFVSTGERGTGQGKLNGDKFTFTFGKSHRDSKASK